MHAKKKTAAKKKPTDTFFKDQHPDLKTEHIIANQPVNISKIDKALLLVLECA